MEAYANFSGAGVLLHILRSSGVALWLGNLARRVVTTYAYRRMDLVIAATGALLTGAIFSVSDPV